MKTCIKSNGCGWASWQINGVDKKVVLLLFAVMALVLALRNSCPKFRYTLYSRYCWFVGWLVRLNLQKLQFNWQNSSIIVFFDERMWNTLIFAYPSIAYQARQLLFWMAKLVKIFYKCMRSIPCAACACVRACNFVSLMSFVHVHVAMLKQHSFWKCFCFQLQLSFGSVQCIYVRLKCCGTGAGVSVGALATVVFRFM